MIPGHEIALRHHLQACHLFQREGGRRAVCLPEHQPRLRPLHETGAVLGKAPQALIVKAINSLERRFGKLFYKLFKSITVDNGCEFQDFEGIEAAHRRKGKRTIVFFCHPYSAFERGSNENMNRLIRRFFPKGTSFDTVKPEEVRAAERWVNNYPRKLLGWKSAAMLFEKELLSA